MKNKPQALPVTMAECLERGWSEVDIVLVSGDAYIDHPSFGIAMIGRLLEAEGYRVAVLSQPEYRSADDFRRFGRPLLFFGISAGNLDSIVANYSGNGKVRSRDAYSPDGNPWRGDIKDRGERRRPDRASLIYANLAKAAFKDSTIILGGIEASLRRFVHYDYKQQLIRGSLLSDAKADLLIYGMGERAVVETARRLKQGLPLHGIAGSCEKLTKKELDQRGERIQKDLLWLPSFAEIQKNTSRFMTAERLIDQNCRESGGPTLIQKQQSAYILQHPPPPPLDQAELDRLYELPFSRRPHPEAAIPAFEMIRDSVTIVRGCPGNCSFCAISRHQGPVVRSRSKESIVRELRTIASQPGFRGTISDLGGPTANLYLAGCRVSGCRRHDCLFPKVCPNLTVDEQGFLELLEQAADISGINHLFISSGLRMSLLLMTPKLLKAIVSKHTPGAMKIAPEHASDRVLELMHKEPHQLLVDFVRLCRGLEKELHRPIHLTPYIISSHPGSTEKDGEVLVRRLRQLGLTTCQHQDFTPTPGTLSTAMFVTGLHRDHDQAIHVPKGQAERNKQRQQLESGLRPRTRVKQARKFKKAH